MRRMTQSCNGFTALRLWALGSFLPIALSAQPLVGPTVKSYIPKQSVSFEEARSRAERAYADAKQKATAITWTPNTSGTSTTPPEIVELARALQNDPDLIYQYVHDNIEFSPLWGSLKGPVGTLLDGRGDSFDQSALMVALLNQASLTNPAISNVVFEFGSLLLNGAQLQTWLGVDSDPGSVQQVLNSGAIPSNVSGVGTGNTAILEALVGHVWVKVSINGVPCVFDPAFKSHNWKAGIVGNLAGIMGYTQAGFLADANPTVTATSVQGVNRNQLRADLTKYATSLASYIRQSAPTAGVSDLLGGATILPTPLTNGITVRQPANPNQSLPYLFSGDSATDYTSIPSQYYATLSITLPGAASYTFNSTDIYGHRLSIFFDTNYVPTLYLDGAAVVSGTASTQGAQVPIVISISLPFATFANQTKTQYISAQTNQNGGSAGYVIQTGWDQVGRGMIEKHRSLLSQAIKSGAAANSELVLGESLAIQGYTWLAECAAQQRISDQLLGTATQYYYGGGIVGEAMGVSTVSPYVDLPLNFINTPPRINGSTTGPTNSLAAFLDSSGASSSFESASLEQTQAQIPGFVAASTVKLLDTAVQNGDTIFDINNGNTSASLQTYTNTIRPQLVPNYNSGTLSQIDNYVNQGYRVIAPLHGQIAVGAWTGTGFKTLLQNGTAYSYGEIISGGLSGGFGGINDPPPIFGQNAANSILVSVYDDSPYVFYQGPGGTGTIGDPVDHFKGSYQYKHDDLTTGARAFPFGLTFQRSYDSNAQGSVGPLGFGWTHNFAITAAVGSDGFDAMGQASPLGAVASIVALYVSSDLIKGQAIEGDPNIEYFALETVVNRWFTDELTQNVVIVSQGWSTEKFVKVPDGTYAPQVGSATILDAPGGKFRYRTKSGITQIFNASGQIVSWANAAGALVNFNYSGSNLSSVKNSATGRQLSFGYSGGLISSVSDGTRTISYGYNNGNLTGFNDALGQTTTFAYDASGTYDTAGHLTQVFYPSHPSNPFVSNFYDSLGRVNQQKDANGNLSQAFFAGSRTEIDDPVGNRNVWYNDQRGNVTSTIQDYGYSSHLNITTVNTYDGQGNLSTVTRPEGNYITYSYDALFNPLAITESPKPGSTLSPLTRVFTYATPVATLPNFEEVATSSDPNGNTTSFSYNPNTGTLSKITRPSVSKPGAGTSTPQEQFTYTAIGLPQTVQDAEGRVTSFTYDPTHAEEVVTSTVDYGRLNLVTQYGYDAYGDKITVTDANGNITTRKYDSTRRLIEIDGAIAGVVTKFSYTPDGLLSTLARQLSTGNFETTQYAYTLSDKLSTVTDPLGGLSTTTYDVDDRKLTATQQVTLTQNRQRTFSYDPLSRPFQLSDTTSGTPGTLLETHTYTPNGKEQVFADANGHVTTYAYDGVDRLSQTTYPDSTTESYQYDANGDIVKKTTRSGQTISFTYDALNRPSAKTPQGEAAGTVNFGYDFTGKLLQASDSSSSSPYQIGYDTAGRANSFTDQLGRNTQVQYDAVGNRTRLQWPAGTSGTASYFVTYSFDALNRPTEIDANGSSATPLAKYQWDALSRQTQITYGDGTIDSYSEYDAGDNLRVLSEIFNGGVGEVSFSYGWQKDHQRQSTAVNNPSFQFVSTTGTDNYSSDVDNAYITAGTANLSYDGNHNLTFDGFNTLAYDVENRLIRAQNGVSGTIEYQYDPLGRRKQKVVSGVATQFILAGNDEIADYSGSPSGVGIPLMLTVRGFGRLPIAAIAPASGVVTYYHHDSLGSTVAVTQTGISGPADTYSYGEFGTPGAGTWAAYRFAGYRYDSETGAYYVRARYYSPTLGRFLQPDPIGRTGGANLYAYVANNPLGKVDPKGLTPDGPQVGSSNLPSPYRYTQPGETYYRYESGNADFSRIGPNGGVSPGTYAAPSSDGPVNQNQLNEYYNLPNPEIPRTQMYEINPPPGTPIIGPSPVSGGIGNEVTFPSGAPAGSATLTPTPVPGAVPAPPVPVEPVIVEPIVVEPIVVEPIILP